MSGSCPRGILDLREAGRAGFVNYQLDVARKALMTGGVGAACVALRVLFAEDFESGTEAAPLLGVIRDVAETDDARFYAVKHLLDLRPSPSTPWLARGVPVTDDFTLVEDTPSSPG